VHQVRAFQRLSTWNKEAQPTLMTTGTGSGKIMFDGAQVFRLGRDLVFNVSTENHRIGARWLARHLGDDYTVHVIEIGDNHIDAKILPLRPGTHLRSAATVSSWTSSRRRCRSGTSSGTSGSRSPSRSSRTASRCWPRSRSA
jgi:hypothetical protein